jgi:hypothetical protein
MERSMRCGTWANDGFPGTPRKTQTSSVDATNSRRNGRLLQHGVGVHLAAGARADRLSGRGNHRSTRSARHRSTRDPAAGGHRSATGRHSEQALSGARPSWLAPILHKARRPRPHLGRDVGFRERIVSIERSRIGIARTGKDRRQPSRGRTSGCGDQQRRHNDDNVWSTTVDHFTILRNGRQVTGRIDCRSRACLSSARSLG